MKTRSLPNISLAGMQQALVAIALLALVIPARAGTYDVRHNFTLRPGGNVVPQVQVVYYAHAWGRTFGPACVSSDVQPPAATQPVGWGPFGTDRIISKGAVRHRDGPNSVLATQGRMNVGAAGIGLTTWSASAFGCPSARAQANSQASVNAFGAGGLVTGTIRAFGFANASAPPPRRAESYAFSMTMVEARGGRQLKNGKIHWGKVVRDVVSGRASARRQVDPIEYTVTDLFTGEVTTGTLFTVTVDIPSSSVGGFIWESNKVEITASNLTFHVGFPSSHTSLQGDLLVEVTDGLVTKATGTGQYAGSVPPLGATLPVSLPLPNEIEFDYDLGDFNGDDLEVGLDFSGAGETADEAATDWPWLTITVADPTTALVEYYSDGRPYLLESTPTLSPAHWLPVSTPPIMVEDRVTYVLPRSPSEPGRFFRLRGEQSGDTEPPTFQAVPECGAPVVIVQYSEPVEPASATNPLNYQLMALPPATLLVMQAQMMTPRSVMLVLNQPLLPGSSYQLFVQGVKDLAGNAIPPGSSAGFQCPP